jgi:hypothetical protein
MNARNQWITFVKDTVIRWGAFLPAPRGDAEALIRFGTGVVDSGNRNSVYRVVRAPAARPYESALQSFETYLRSQVLERGRIPIFPEDASPGAELWTPARIAFYRGDAVVEEEIGDVGALLRELRPDKIETCGMFMRGASPVTVLGGSVPVDWAQEVRVQIRLDTDIWFPYVTGMCEEIPEEGNKPDLYDNRELAARHTPRLNAFLGEIRRLSIELGGRWEVLDLDGFAVNYAQMWDEAGIRF